MPQCCKNYHQFGVNTRTQEIRFVPLEKKTQIAALTKKTRVFSEFSGLRPFSSLLEVSIQLSMSL